MFNKHNSVFEKERFVKNWNSISNTKEYLRTHKVLCISDEKRKELIDDLQIILDELTKNSLDI